LHFLYEQPEENSTMAESPTCVVEFVDGEITRMTTWSATGKPDGRRGIRLARHAYRSRTGREPPAIKSMHFESEGGQLLPLAPEEIEFSEFRYRDRADRWLQAVERRQEKRTTLRSSSVPSSSQ